MGLSKEKRKKKIIDLIQEIFIIILVLFASIYHIHDEEFISCNGISKTCSIEKYHNKKELTEKIENFNLIGVYKYSINGKNNVKFNYELLYCDENNNINTDECANNPNSKCSSYYNSFNDKCKCIKTIKVVYYTYEAAKKFLDDYEDINETNRGDFWFFTLFLSVFWLLSLIFKLVKLYK